MAILDILILMGLVIGLWQGFSAGLLKSLVGLFGWLVALIFATYFAKPLSPMLAGLFDTPVLTLLASFILVALFVLIGLHLMLWVMSHTLKGLKLGILDKLAGAFFGVGKNFLMILLLLSAISPFIQHASFWKNATIANQLLPLTPFAVDLSKKIANEVRDNSQQGFGHLDKMSKNLETSPN